MLAKQVEQQTFSRPGNIENIAVCPPPMDVTAWPITKISEISWDVLHSSPQSYELARRLPELVQHLPL